MGQLGAKLRTIAAGGSFGGGLGHWCPACESMHAFSTLAPQKNNGARWTWDGNEALPTFAPSMNISAGPYKDGETTIPLHRCHYILAKGVITYLADCTHSLRGQAVPLPDLPDFLTDAFEKGAGGKV